MPYLGGHDIISLSSTLERRPPFIIVTANTRLNDYAKGTGTVVDYLVKPVDRDRLMAVVERALGRPVGAAPDRLTRSFLLSDRIVTDSEADDPGAAHGIANMLGHARSEYRRLVAGVPIPYVVLDEGTYRVRYCSDAFLRFLGLVSVSDARRLSFFDLFDAGVKERTVDTLRKTGVLRHEELHGRTPAGRPFVIVGSFRLSSSDGSAEGGFVDITRAQGHRAGAGPDEQAQRRGPPGSGTGA